MNQLRGRNGKIYNIGRELAHGGEGKVCYVNGDDSILLKLYFPTTKSDKMAALEKKLTVMVNDKNFDAYVDTEHGRVLRFAWPTDLLYDMSGKFVGFVMPNARNTYEFHELMWPDRREQFKQYDYKRSIAVSFNLTQAVQYAHDRGYVLGDMNVKNFRFDRNCYVIVLDVDSFDVVDRATGAHYKCSVGTGDYLAPELQGVGDLSRPSARFTRESDYFSMALLVFQFLMDGTHPFNAPRITTGNGYSSSASANPMQTDIANGNCPYVRTGTGKAIPAYAPDFVMLPANLRELFRRTFGYTQSTAVQAISGRATAAEFGMALYHFYSRTDKVTCPTDSRHIYLSRLSSCPFCARNSKQSPKQNPVAGNNTQAQTVTKQPAAARTTAAPTTQPVSPNGFAKVTNWVKKVFS